MNTLFVYLLGSFRIRRNKSSAPIRLRRKTGAVLAYLASTGEPHTRQALAEMFCQEVKDPLRALRSILSRIRQRLGSEALLTKENLVQFNQAVGWVDCVAFAQSLDVDHISDSPETIAATIDLYQGEFLENVNVSGSPEFEFWLLNERTRYQKLYERGLATLVAQLAARGDVGPAIERALELVHRNPLLEDAHAHLMWLYARSGRREAALAQYEQCRTLLQRELAVAPTPELGALRREIATGQLSLSPPLRASIIQAAPFTPRRGAFVGRSHEMAQLQQAWQAASAGHSPVVLLDAEAGMGKTSTVHEFARTLPKAEFLVGACYESTRSLSYYPWLDVLEARLARLDETALEQLSPFAVDYLARLLPALARRLRRARPPVLSTAGGEVSRLFTAVGEFLLELPGTPPLLLFIDNLQWADDASLQLFHFLVRRSAPVKVLLIGAMRTEEVGSAPALQSLIRDLQQHSLIHLPLPPLTSQGITHLTAQLWPALPVGYRSYVSDMLFKATGGNPLFVSEILRELAHTTEVPSALPVPQSVNELIQRRLNLLPGSGRQVVEAMAVLGSPATPAQVEEASGRSQEETVTAIDTGLRQGLLKAAGAARYDFSHDLIREGVLGHLSQVRRQLLHRRAAATLERAGAPAATLAHHWRMAGDVEEEGHYAALAGAKAAALYANEEAVRYLERALSLVAEPEARLQIMGQLGNVWVLTGEWEKAEAIFNQALALAEAGGNRPQQAHFQGALGKLASRRGLYPQALSWLKMAQDICQALGDRSGVAGHVGTMGIVYWQQDDYDEALACYRQALEIESEVNNEPGIAIWTGNIGSIYHQKGDDEQALAFFERSLHLRRKLNMKLEVGIVTGNIGDLYYGMGDYLKALGYHGQALHIRQELGDKAGIATVLGHLGRDYASLGADQTALACFQTALQYNLELGNWEGIALQLGRLGEVLAGEGDYRQALACFDRSIDLFRRLGAPYYLSRRLNAKAGVLFSLAEYSAAQLVNEEVQRSAPEVDHEVEFATRLLALRLQVALGRLETSQVTTALLGLGKEFSRPQQRAALHYEIWRLNPDSPSARQHAAKAAGLYRHLYNETYQHEYRRRYEQMTGKSLRDPPRLPALPEMVTAEPVPLDILFTQVDHFVAG